MDEELGVDVSALGGIRVDVFDTGEGGGVARGGGPVAGGSGRRGGAGLWRRRIGHARAGGRLERGSLEARRRGSAEARRRGSAEARKRGSARLPEIGGARRWTRTKLAMHAVAPELKLRYSPACGERAAPVSISRPEPGVGAQPRNRYSVTVLRSPPSERRLAERPRDPRLTPNRRQMVELTVRPSVARRTANRVAPNESRSARGMPNDGAPARSHR